MVEIFEDEGFKFYPEWRETHSTGKLKNFTFKVDQRADRFENIITIYPMSGWLKVEVYRGQYNKTHYRVGIETINSPYYMKALIEDAKDIYNSLSALKI